MNWKKVLEEPFQVGKTVYSRHGSPYIITEVLEESISIMTEDGTRLGEFSKSVFSGDKP